MDVISVVSSPEGLSAIPLIPLTHAERVEPVEISEAIREIEEKMKGNTITDLVITGGEPLLQKEALGELLREFKNRHKEVKITVETNGSILPTETLFHYVSLWSVSPSYANSGCSKDGCAGEGEEDAPQEPL